MSQNVSKSQKFGVGFSNGIERIKVPLIDGLDTEKDYRFTYEITNHIRERIYPKTVDMIVSGDNLLRSHLTTFYPFEDQYKSVGGPPQQTLLHYKHHCKDFTIMYSYLTIMGNTPSVRRKISKITQISSKDQKWLIKDRELLLHWVKSYFYTKIEEDHNSYLITDVIGMSDEELTKWLSKMDVDEQFNNGVVNKLFDNKKQWIESMKEGYIGTEKYNSDLSNIGTIH